MIDINFVRENPDIVKTGMERKFADTSIIDKFLKIDDEWKELKKITDNLRATQKKLGPESRNEAREIKEEISSNDEKINILAEERDFLVSQIPNLPEDDIPVGKDESANEVIKESGKPRDFSFKPKDYVDIAGSLIDTERASKISGSRFGYILGDIALLEFALFRFGIDTLIPYGFKMAIPPVMIKPDIMRRMGKGKFIDGGDAFYVSEDDLYLVGSSEQSIAPMFMDEVISLDEPKRFLGFSTCFRKEAGSYGKDTRGILRVHQFNKLEMFSICRPEDSRKEHEFLLERQEELMSKLNLPYRVVVNSTGDMSFDASRQCDIEVWIPSQDKYRETHSCSNTTDFQSRGLNITYKKDDGNGKQKKEFVHTLNATAFSERPLLAILENFQREDGSVEIPEVLIEYFGKDEILSGRQ
ncbi:MAG: serine--tRNA ligase [Candidatus Colwellbacteria bacterium]|jgi:seryl-tRNA synthetase|nr:serine--tRNA ligase [Candidatus Colwellbacteria bacterium]MCK9497605.1 serine--tRNA ligase [Candidatus Colwellbacteria bacterium]MDD4818802.1 serine--tRNA ligase [Candidatus Colwellbacteria bacterium]